MPVPPWPLYLAGTIAVVLGFATLHRWIRGLTGRAREAHRSVLAGAGSLFLGAIVILSVAVLLDSEQVRIENTRAFLYEVSVVPDPAGPFRIRLPAPADNRLFARFNQTDSSAQMVLNRTGSTPFVEVSGTEPTTLRFEHQVVGSSFNRTLSEVTPSQPGGAGNVSAMADIEFIDLSSGNGSAVVSLSIVYDEFCALTRFTLEAQLDPGRASYPAQWSVTARGC